MKVSDVSPIFEESPKLKEIGSKTNYIKYLKTIFPESRVKQIAYHYSDKKEFKFKSNFIEGYAAKAGGPAKAIFFMGQAANKDSFLSKRQYLGRYLINLKNPWKFPKDMDRSDKRKSGIKEGAWEALEKGNDGTIFDHIWDNQMWCDVFVVFNPKQIHELGSAKDIKGFNEFMLQ